jgi:hypothetical protein
MQSATNKLGFNCSSDFFQPFVSRCQLYFCLRHINNRDEVLRHVKWMPLMAFASGQTPMTIEMLSKSASCLTFPNRRKNEKRSSHGRALPIKTVDVKTIL